MAWRWRFNTSSYFSTFLRISKFWASTWACADWIERAGGAQGREIESAQRRKIVMAQLRHLVGLIQHAQQAETRAAADIGAERDAHPGRGRVLQIEQSAAHHQVAGRAVDEGGVRLRQARAHVLQTRRRILQVLRPGRSPLRRIATRHGLVAHERR